VSDWIAHNGRGASKPTCKVSAVMFRNRRVIRPSKTGFRHGGIWDWSFRKPKRSDIVAYKLECPPPTTDAMESDNAHPSPL
jgi:hypothetical protein